MPGNPKAASTSPSRQADESLPGSRLFKAGADLGHRGMWNVSRPVVGRIRVRSADPVPPQNSRTGFFAVQLPLFQACFTLKLSATPPSEKLKFLSLLGGSRACSCHLQLREIGTSWQLARKTVDLRSWISTTQNRCYLLFRDPTANKMLISTN